MDLELLRYRLNSFLLTWMIGETHKTQLLLEVTLKAMDVSTQNAALIGGSRRLVSLNQERKGSEDTTAAGDDHNSGMNIFRDEHIDELGNECSPARIRGCRRDGGVELHPEYSQRGATDLAHLRQRMQ